MTSRVPSTLGSHLASHLDAAVQAKPAPSPMPRPAQHYEFDGAQLDMARRELRRPHGDVVALTAAEFALLALLVQKPAEAISRDELATRLKGRSWSPLDRSIDVLVARLRRKIDQPHLIKSVRGVGYVFTGKVTSGPAH